MHDVFISYSRKDKSFVEQLVAKLEQAGRDVWVDFEDIPFAAEWWDEICAGIDNSQSVLFVISPDSVESKVCGLEMSQAIKNKKRLIPILYRETTLQSMQTALSHLNWLSFDDEAKFDHAFQQLSQTLDTDLNVTRKLTRLLVRAREWEQKGHTSSLLLRGDELTDMQSLSASADLSDIQRIFLERSSEAERQWQLILRFMFGFFGGFLGMGYWVFSEFISNILITPTRLVYTLAFGQAFGLFIGLMSILVENLPLAWEKTLSTRTRSLMRVVGCLGLGILAWTAYSWLLESFVLSPTDINTVVLGGVGLAGGFIVRNIVRLPGWANVLLTAALAWLPIYITLDAFRNGSETVRALMLFNDSGDARVLEVFSVAIPFALLVALGANALSLGNLTRWFQEKINQRLSKGQA